MKTKPEAGQPASQPAGQQLLTGRLTTPAREEGEMTRFCVPLDSQPAQDPAPTTMCERGLGPISGKEIKTSHLSSCGRGWNTKKVGVILQGRDKEIMRLCYEQQFLLGEQVLTFFYAGKNRCNGFVRLKELERSGLIRWLDEPMLDRKRLIRLTWKGLREIEGDLIIQVPQVGKPDIRTLRHDASVTSVRLRLQQLWNGSWIPEKALKQADFPQIPDGIFIFPSGKKVAVEVESSIKSKPRLLAIFERWRRVDIKLVLYVATTEAVLSNVRRCIEAGPRTVPLALVHYQDLMGQVTPVWTRDGKVDVFSQKEY